MNSLKTDDPALTAAMFLMALAVERCRERRNPNFSIELGEGIVRLTHSGGLPKVLFGCHCFCPLLNEEARGELR